MAPQICDYENAADLRGEPSDLTSIPTLAERLKANLTESKGRPVQNSEILVASIHGAWSPFEGAMPACKDGDASDCPEVPFACSNPDLGVAFSGDRYDRFMRQFPNYYPNAVTGGDDEKRRDFKNFQDFGEICAGDFSSSLGAIGDFVSTSMARCITDRVTPCSASDECEDAPFGGTSGTCLAPDGSGGLAEIDGEEPLGFCDTSITLSLLRGDGALPLDVRVDRERTPRRRHRTRRLRSQALVLARRPFRRAEKLLFTSTCHSMLDNPNMFGRNCV